MKSNSMSLDKFLGSKASPPEERCSNPKCHKKLEPKDTKFTLTIKGKEQLYCMDCYKAKLKPLEEAENL